MFGLRRWQYNCFIANLTAGNKCWWIVADDIASVLSNQDGILVKADKSKTQGGACGDDARQFNGVFIRYLGHLNQLTKDCDIQSLILKNADSV